MVVSTLVRTILATGIGWVRQRLAPAPAETRSFDLPYFAGFLED
jgi:hypothetical protein